jgi:hypothetical protein
MKEEDWARGESINWFETIRYVPPSKMEGL